MIFVLSLFATFVLRMMSRVFSERTLLVADAIGLGLFSISGTRSRSMRGCRRSGQSHDGRRDGRVRRNHSRLLCNDVLLILRDSDHEKLHIFRDRRR